MKTVEVEVTEADIKQGEPDCAFGCAVALACERAGLQRPGVDRWWIDEHGPTGKRIRSYRTPPEVAEFIAKFDNDRPVHPFSFELIEESR